MRSIDNHDTQAYCKLYMPAPLNLSGVSSAISYAEKKRMPGTVVDLHGSQEYMSLALETADQDVALGST